MNDSKKYTVIELADILGVPRTTINDWLTRYSQYIDYKMQGKRKIYLESSLVVLREISDLRDSGKSSFDIEEEIAKKHPVHGEVAESSAQDVEGDEEDPSDGNGSGGDYALIAKKQSDEIAKMISENLHNISMKMGDIEDLGAKSVSRSGRWSVMAFLLFAALLAVCVLAAYKITEYSKMYSSLQVQNKVMQSELSLKNSALGEKEKALDAVVTKLEKNTDDYRKHLSSLETDLKKQDAEFKQLLENMEKEKEAGKIKEAQIVKMRDEFAGQRLSFLKQLEENKKELTSKEDQIKTFQKQQQAIKKLIDEFQQGQAAGGKAKLPIPVPAQNPNPKDVKKQEPVKTAAPAKTVSEESVEESE